MKAFVKRIGKKILRIFRIFRPKYYIETLEVRGVYPMRREFIYRSDFWGARGITKWSWYNKNIREWVPTLAPRTTRKMQSCSNFKVTGYRKITEADVFKELL